MKETLEKTKNIFAKEKGKSFVLFILFSFLLGFLLGWLSNDSSMSDVELDLENLNLDLRSFNEYIMFAETFKLDTCDKAFIEYLGENIYESGATLEDMEEEGQTNTPEYDLLKQKHNINQVIYYSELKKFKDECGYDKNIILFFFDGEKPEISQRQGKIIGEITKQKNITLLPMDYEYTKYIDYFYQYYDVEELPTLIINYETMLEGITLKDELLQHLN